jgi:hypothetical protein
MSYSGCSSCYERGSCGSSASTYRPMSQEMFEAPLQHNALPQSTYFKQERHQQYQPSSLQSLAKIQPQSETHYSPFLNSTRIQHPLPNNMQELIEEAFEKTTNESLPDDIIIHLLDEEEFAKASLEFSNSYSESVQGFALNRKHLNQKSEIFVKKQDLAKTMLVVGHEIGHVLTPVLNNKRAEEAKAYTFEVAFIKAIHKHNVGDLKYSLNISSQPANNGLHDKAYNYIIGKLNEGIDTLDIFKELVTNTPIIY